MIDGICFGPVAVGLLLLVEWLLRPRKDTRT
jgi:hypothetical protein